jgi:hypothetical protein
MVLRMSRSSRLAYVELSWLVVARSIDGRGGRMGRNNPTRRLENIPLNVFLSSVPDTQLSPSSTRVSPSRRLSMLSSLRGPAIGTCDQEHPSGVNAEDSWLCRLVV